MNRQVRLTLLLVMILFAAMSTVGVGSPVAPAAAAGECQAYVYEGIDDAKTSFRDQCGRAWDAQVRDQCTWVLQPIGGWVCHTYAPNGPSNPQLPPGNPPAPTTPRSAASGRSAGTSDVSGYWTTERMENAKDVLTGASVSQRTQPPQTDFREESIPSEFRKTTGRAFFTLPGIGDSSCFGSVVNTEGKNTVWTAGHCVHLDGSWATNWIFVPGYDNGEAPYGKWTAKALWSLAGWVNGGNTTLNCGAEYGAGDLRYDIGVAVLHPLNGRDIVRLVGGNGLAFNQPISGTATAYSSERGSGPGGCSGSVSERDVVGCTSGLSTYGRSGFIGVSCAQFGPGSSGGGIFVTRSGSPQHLTGVISHVDSRQPEIHFSPYFGQGAVNLYEATRNQ